MLIYEDMLKYLYVNSRDNEQCLSLQNGHTCNQNISYTDRNRQNMQPVTAWGWWSTVRWLKCYDEQNVPADIGLIALLHFTVLTVTKLDRRAAVKQTKPLWWFTVVSALTHKHSWNTVTKKLQPLFILNWSEQSCIVWIKLDYMVKAHLKCLHSGWL